MYLWQLSKKNLEVVIPKISCMDGVCLGCVIGKKNQDNFSEGKALHSMEPVELVYSDLMSFPTRSFSGARYELTLFRTSPICLGCTFLSTRVRHLLFFKTSSILSRRNHTWDIIHLSKG
jgi:hypothetical protein